MLDGPLALDNAIDLGAAQIKNIDSPVAGRANVLVVPDLEAGNMLAKSLTLPGRRRCRGHRARRAGADHPDEPRRLAADAARVLRRRLAGRRCSAQQAEQPEV